MSFSPNNYYQWTSAHKSPSLFGTSVQFSFGGFPAHQKPRFGTSSQFGPAENVTQETPIASVAAATPTVMKHLRGTTFEKYSSFCTWTVKGLKTLREGTTSTECIPFPHQICSEWCMILTNNSDGLHLKFMLTKSETEMPLAATVKADEILPTGEKREVFPRTFCSLKQGEKTEMICIRKSDATEDDNNLDEITLQCEICMQCIIQEEQPADNTAEPHSSVVKGLAEMLHEEVHADFELRAGGTVLKAHRALLAVRSPYFADKLQPHTKESQEGFVEVSDVKPEVLKQVLLFIYTGEAPALEDMQWDLLEAAHKYRLLQLKRQCEAHLASCLTVDNAAETAVEASRLSCDMLWDLAVIFIKRNVKQVMGTAGWTEAITKHPKTIKLISELMA